MQYNLNSIDISECRFSVRTREDLRGYIASYFIQVNTKDLVLYYCNGLLFKSNLMHKLKGVPTRLLYCEANRLVESLKEEDSLIYIESKNGYRN